LAVAGYSINLRYVRLSISAEVMPFWAGAY